MEIDKEVLTRLKKLLSRKSITFAEAQCAEAEFNKAVAEELGKLNAPGKSICLECGEVGKVGKPCSCGE